MKEAHRSSAIVSLALFALGTAAIPGQTASAVRQLDERGRLLNEALRSVTDPSEIAQPDLRADYLAKLEELERMYRSVSAGPLQSRQCWMSRDIAWGYRMLGDLEASKAWLERARSNATKCPAGHLRHRHLTLTWWFEARLQEECEANLAAALAARQHMLTHRRKLPAISIEWLGLHLHDAHRLVARTHSALGDPGSALPHLEEAVALLDRKEARVHAWHTATMQATWSEYGRCLVDLGRGEEALAALSKSLEVARNTPGSDIPSYTASTLSALADLAELDGDPVTALSLHEECLAVLQREGVGSAADLAWAHCRLARTCQSLGRYEEAVASQRAALSTFDEYGEEAIAETVLLQLAEAALRGGELDICTTALERWTSRPRSSETVDPATRARIETLRAGVLLASGRERHALDACDAAREALADDPATDATNELATETALLRSRVLEALGDRRGSLSEAALAVQIARGASRTGRLLVVAASRQAALLLEHEPERLGSAIELLEEVVAALDDARAASAALDPIDRARYLADLREYEPYELLSLAHVRAGNVEKAVETLEAARGRTVSEVLSGTAAPRLDGLARDATARGDEALLHRISEVQQQLDEARAAMAKAVGTAMDDGTEIPAAVEDATRRLRSANRLEAALLAEAAVSNPAPTPDLGRIRRLLDRENAMVYWSLQPVESLLFVVPKRGPVSCHRLALDDEAGGGPDALTAKLGEFLALLSASGEGAPDRGRGRGRGRGAARATDLAAQLFRMLVPSDAWKRISELEQIYAVPDADLYRVPLDALVVDMEDGRPVHWIERGPAVVTCPSAAALTLFREAARSRKKRALELVALGDPVYDGTFADAGERARLEESGREARALYEIYTDRPWSPEADRRKAVALLGEEATERRLFEAAQRAEILHVAAHHFPDPRPTGTLGRIPLARPQEGPGGADDDGALTLDDLLTRWTGHLAGCDFVVLSACSSAVGPTYSGEGVLALPLGFLSAGTPAVLTTSVSIGDASAADLMIDFHRTLRDDRRTTPVRALISAKRNLLAAGAPLAAWAPFVWIGWIE